MQVRSFIFSSEKSFFTASLFWTVLFVIMFAGGDWLWRQTRCYQYRFGARLGNAVRVLQKQIKLQDASSIVIFTGTSKMHSAIDPATIEKSFPEKRCLNLSLNSMTYWEILKMLQYAQADGRKIELVVCEVAPFMFNANCLNPANRRPLDNGLQLDIWGNKDDIANQDSFKARYTVIKKMLFGPLRLEDIFSALKNSEPEILPPPVYHTDLELEKKLAARQAFSPEFAATAHINNFMFSQYSVYCFKQIVNYCKQNKIKLLLLELPSAPEYTRILFEQMPEKAKSQYQTLLIESGATVVTMRNLEEYDLDNSIFVDYAHFSSNGKLLFSEILCKKILLEVFSKVFN